jgi:hypothetical protein
VSAILTILKECEKDDVVERVVDDGVTRSGGMMRVSTRCGEDVLFGSEGAA